MYCKLYSLEQISKQKRCRPDENALVFTELATPDPTTRPSIRTDENNTVSRVYVMKEREISKEKNDSWSLKYS